MASFSRGFDEEGRAYLREKNIDALFQSLLAGLVHTRPDDHIGFLLTCVDRLTKSDIRKEHVFWDSFLNITSEGNGNNRLPPADKNGANDTSSPGKVGDTSPVEQGSHRQEYETQPSQAETVMSDDEDDEPSEDILANLGAQGRAIMEGVWGNLPAMPSRTVRIFLSSTFTDFKAERNYLPRFAYPEIQKHCMERGLDFQVVDMRWGVTDEIANDHQVSSLCLEEVRRCQEISAGPSFVVMLGNRYGFQPFPAVIEASEFELFKEVSSGLESCHMALVAEWFLLDENAVPPHYVLQPIVQKLPNYNSGNSKTKPDVPTDNDKWIQIRTDISETLRTCAKTAFNKNLIGKESYEKYFQSVTEEEVTHGIFHSDRPHDHALCFIRSLTGLNTDTTNTNCGRYMDIRGGRPDRVAQERLKELTSHKIPLYLKSSQIQTYNVQWKGEKLENSSEADHKDYLHNFCEDFVTRVKELIDRTTSVDSDQDDVKQLYIEVLHHAKFASLKTEVFHGRETEIALIKNYLTKDKIARRTPLVVVAESGFGKTSLMAVAAMQIREVCGPSTYTITRFLGTSPRSSDILQTLQSIIIQVCALYNLPLPDSKDMKTYSDTRRLFLSTLEATSKDTEKRRIVILLDAVDQLKETYNVFTMSWLPRQMPKSVFLLVSMLPNQRNCLDNTKRHLPVETPYIYLTPLSDTNAKYIILSALKKSNRCLTKEQMLCLMSKIHNNLQPLFLKLILDQALTWNSYTPVDSLQLASTVRDAIDKLFETIEIRFGRVFVRHALGYLSCGKGGLTAVEIEDALSCDDVVLSDVYKYHDPPQEDVIRIPTLMWSRVHHALYNYLTERQEDNKTVHTWYHRQFWECADRRYLSDCNQLTYLHSTLADIFLQSDGVKRSVTLKHRQCKLMENVDRRVAEQPLNPTNLRKLTVLPYHLFHAKRLGDLKMCLLNFDWILTKLMACDTFGVIKEYSYFKNAVIKDKEFILVSDLLLLTADALWNDPLLLAYQISERLSPLSDMGSFIAKICHDANEWLRKSHVPLLLPTHRLFLKKPNSPMKMQLTCGSDCKLSVDEQFLVSLQIESLSGVTKVNVLNANSKEVITSFESNKSRFYEPTNDGRLIVYVDFSYVKIHDILTGDFLKKIPYITTPYKKITVRCMAISQRDKFVIVGVRVNRGDAPAEEKDRKREVVMLYLIDLDKYKTITAVPFGGKKVIDRVFFVSNDQFVLASSRDKICIMNVPKLDAIYELKIKFGELVPKTSKVDQGCQRFISVVKESGVAKVAQFDLETRTISYSQEVNKVTDEYIDAFFLDVHPIGNIVIGCSSYNKPFVSSVCKWKQSADTCEMCNLSTQGFNRGPTTMALLPDWTFAFVGWGIGAFTVVDLTSMQEVTVIRFDGQPITKMMVPKNGEQLLTFEQDNTLRQWDVKMILDIVHKKLRNTKHDTQRTVLSENASKYDTEIIPAASTASDSHQCIEVHVDKDDADRELEYGQNPDFKETTTTNEAMHTETEGRSNRGHRHKTKRIEQWNDGNVRKIIPCFDFEFIDSKIFLVGIMDAPIVYRLENGMPEEKISSGIFNSCVHYNEKQNIKLDYISFGNIHWLGGVQAMYERVENINRLIWIIELIHPNYEIVFHVQLKNVYYAMVADVPLEDDSKPYYFARRQEHLEIYRLPDMTLIRKIDMISIKEDIPQMNSRAGRLRLGLYTCGITIDGKYFLTTNTAVITANSQKALDIIDLQNEASSRTTVPKDKSHQLWMSHSFYMFTWEKDCGHRIMNPNRYNRFNGTEKGKHAYRCLIYRPGTKYFSKDRSIGVQIINKKREFYLWRIDPFTKLHTFRGHSLGVNSVCLTSDNQLLITGSQDKTIRIWSVTSGSQICCFYTDGAVKRLGIDPSNTYIAVLYELGQRRSRCMILKYHQSKQPLRRLTKRMSSTDIWT